MLLLESVFGCRREGGHGVREGGREWGPEGREVCNRQDLNFLSWFLVVLWWSSRKQVARKDKDICLHG